MRFLQTSYQNLSYYRVYAQKRERFSNYYRADIMHLCMWTAALVLWLYLCGCVQSVFAKGKLKAIFVLVAVREKRHEGSTTGMFICAPPAIFNGH